MSSASIHDKLSRVRKPRVHITYEVETEGAKVQRELPFVMGVLGDFSGKPTQPLKPLKDRKFIQIDRDNFDEVMARMTPGLEFRVANTLKGDGSELAVKLKFDALDEFNPDRVVRQVEPLRKLLETRDKLRDLLTKVDRSDELETLLERILKSDDDIKKLSEQLGVSGSGAGPGT
jgi:type VI secretion system protein ImpB